MLASRHCDIHDHGRRLHARLRLYCNVIHGAPKPLTSTNPNTWRTLWTRWDSPMSLSHRSIAMTCRISARQHSAATIRAVHTRRPDCRVEVLIPDFQGQETPLRTVLEARPDVLNHNIETVSRLYRIARPGGRYARGRSVAASRERGPRIPTKSGLMVGLGETWDEVSEVLRDLRQVDCQIPDNRAVSAPVGRSPADGALLYARGIPRTETAGSRSRVRTSSPVRSSELLSRPRAGRQL